MKKLNKIKLTVLNRNEIADKEQRLLKGGADYNCGCISGCVETLKVKLGNDMLVLLFPLHIYGCGVLLLKGLAHRGGCIIIIIATND